MLLEVHNMDIQLCCFLAGIYVCVHLFGCQKFKSSNVFYARARQMMPVAKLDTKWLVIIYTCKDEKMNKVNR